MLVGAHCSIAGGLFKAIERATALGCTALQIFTRNQRQWSANPISADEATLFKKTLEKSSVEFVVSHASYLINMGAAKETLRWKSSEALIAEVERCHALGVPAVVVHAGCHNHAGVEVGLERVSGTLDEVFKRTKHTKVKVLVENTAGQGSALGSQLEELQSLVQMVPTDRLGFCIDTCHAFAAGYDFGTLRKWQEFVKELEKNIGLHRLSLFHLNDCKAGLGEHKDRHEHLGEGKIGAKAFAHLLQEKRFLDVPKIIETPKEGGRSGKPMVKDKFDLKNLAFIKRATEEE